MSQIILKGLDSKLDEILKSTYYQLIYQEQAMEICVKIAGYSMGKADTVRKTIGRKIQSELDALMPDLVEKFQSYGGLTEDKAKLLGEALQACGSYCFNKSHSVEYGLIAYQTAYLKAHYPVQYMCSLLNGNTDVTEDMVKYINECKRMGINILPPSVEVGNLRFAPEGNNIRLGLSCIKGINKLDYTYYDNIKKFFSMNHLNKRVKEALIKAGALDCFEIDRNTLLCEALSVDEEIESELLKVRKATNKIKEKELELSNSKDGTKKVGLIKNTIENQKKIIEKANARISELQQTKKATYDEVAGEMEVLGFTFKDKFVKYNTGDWQIYNPELIILQSVLVEVTEFKKITDKKGKLMAFVKVVPYLSAPCEMVMFSSNYTELKVGKIYGMNIKNKNTIISVNEV